MSAAVVLGATTFAALIFLLLPLTRLSARERFAVLAALILAGAIPIAGAPMAAYARGLLGDLAVTTLVFLFWAVLEKLRGGRQGRALQQRVEPAVFYALLGLVLYPAALGLSMTDPYRLGFEPDWLLVLCGVATVVFSLRGHYVAAIAMILATLAFSLELAPSHNYWDYVLDPLLAVYSSVLVCRWAIAVLRRRSADRTEPAALLGASQQRMP